jgi:Calcineurin-like phosphoesterase
MGLDIMTSHSSISLIFVSDTHIGSIYSIRSTPRNKLQDKLYEGFQKCVNRIKQPKRVDTLLLGGDMIDGSNPAKPGLDLWTVHPEAAVNDTAKLLSPLVKMTKTIRVVRGSGYHVEPGKGLVNSDELLAQKLQATPFDNPLLAEKPYILEHIQKLSNKNIRSTELKQLQTQALAVLNNGTELESTDNSGIPFPRSGVKYKGIFNGVALVLKHQVAFSPNYMYRGTGLTRNDLIMTLQKDRHFSKHYNAIINAYGHVHYYHYTGNATHHNFTIPCWKGSDTFLAANGVTEPDYGIVEVLIEPNSEVTIHPYVLDGADYPVEDLAPLVRHAA